MKREVASLRQRLLAWFDQHRRDLPWRTTTDPYRLWVAETLTQQTQAARAAAYYARFIKRFPTVESLAAADPAEVLKQWEGLGYYQRARRLHEAARLICVERGGALPRAAAEWRTLPGVGDYTAAAVASMAFGEPVAAIDGNVRRVVARLAATAIGDDHARQQTVVWTTAQALAAGERPGDVNQALMELGATVCRPRRPRCDACPLSNACDARQAGLTALYPLRSPRKARPVRPFVCLLVQCADRRLVVRRATTKLLGGLWEFPTIACLDGEADQAAAERCLRELGLTAQRMQPGLTLTHDFTHFRQTLQIFLVEVEAPCDVTGVEAQWATHKTLDELPLTQVARRLAARESLGRNERPASALFEKM
ncbi:MAG: A/G-specific adenine glycosylase [Chloracidobacterium sp.]|nr:A/G-specific adenine glycosylase [Chloracidobacterium sp.]MDW8217126.1 A/G-specific adenine glycosylase [Acidobacteriota bacterium]